MGIFPSIATCISKHRANPLCPWVNSTEDFMIPYNESGEVGRMWFKADGEDGANPDIAGLGVVISFTISAAATLITSIIFTAWCTYKRLSIIRWAGREEVKKYLFFNALFTFAVNLNDTQLITGCAVLAATFSQQCTMSVYHSEIVSWMMPVILAVGFLAPTSIIASIPLQEKWRGWEEIRFRGAEKHRIILTIVRAILTLVMTVFSFIYLGGVATSRSGWPHYALTRRNDPLAVTNAVCYMRNNGPSKTGLEHKHVIEMVILATYFFAWVIFFEMFFRRMILKSIRVNPTWNSDGWRFTLLTHGVLWMSCSLLFYSVVSLITIYDLRRKARDRFFAKDQLSPEDEWGFGQFIAIILIILPVKAFMDAWIDSSEKRPVADNSISPSPQNQR